MDEHKMIPLVAHESSMDRLDRMNKRLTNTLLVILILWFFTIASFVYYITLPVEEETVTTQTVDGVEDSEINQTK